MDSIIRKLIVIRPTDIDILRETLVGEKFTLEQLKLSCEKRLSEERNKVYLQHCLFTTLFLL